MTNIRRRLGAAPLLALAAAAVAAPGAAASCLPGSGQPTLPADAAVGVLRTGQAHTRDLKVLQNVYDATKAQLDASGVNARVLTDAQLADPAQIADLKVLVLPETKALSRAQRRTVLRWVRNGGSLLSLYFSARDDEKGTPLVLTPQGWGGKTEWAELSPAYGARFINDVYMEQASFSFDQSHPIAQHASRYCGGPLPDYHWRRTPKPTALTGELVVPASRGFKTLARLKTVKITWRNPEEAAKPGAVFAWSNQHRKGRIMHVGFNFMDSVAALDFPGPVRGRRPRGPPHQHRAAARIHRLGPDGRLTETRRSSPMTRLPSRLLPLAGLAILAAAGPASGACLPEFDQPDLTPGYSVGILKSAQGTATARKFADDLFKATWQRLEFAGADDVLTLTDADVANPAQLAKVKVLVLANTRALTTAQRTAVASWVKGGGGLVEPLPGRSRHPLGTPDPGSDQAAPRTEGAPGVGAAQPGLRRGHLRHRHAPGGPLDRRVEPGRPGGRRLLRWAAAHLHLAPR